TPLFRSRISWAMRVTARAMSPASITSRSCDRSFWVITIIHSAFWHKKTLSSRSDEKVELCRSRQTGFKPMHTPCSPHRMSIKGSCILRKQEESCQAARPHSSSHHTPTLMRLLELSDGTEARRREEVTLAV